MILIDNYDSFTYNIVQYLGELGVQPQIYKNDEIDVQELKSKDFTSIIISPGPGNPKTAGISRDVIKTFYKTKKILGVCLGHQCIAECFGGQIIKAKSPCHGKLSEIFTSFDDELFTDIPKHFKVTRYHSLIVDTETLPDCIEPLAFITDGILMALKLKEYPVYGLQFHPEAILTEHGKILLKNFIKICY